MQKKGTIKAVKHSGLRFVECPDCGQKYDIASGKYCLKSLLSKETQVVACAKCANDFAFVMDGEVTTMELSQLARKA